MLALYVPFDDDGLKLRAKQQKFGIEAGCRFRKRRDERIWRDQDAVNRAAADVERHCRAAELDEPRRLRHSTPLRPLSYVDAIIDSDASPGIDG